MAYSSTVPTGLPRLLPCLPQREPTSSFSIRSDGSLSSGLTKGGLRAPSDRYALKSSFYNGGSALSFVPSAGNSISMRVASKGAYICRDCGYIYNERKPFEKLPDDFICRVCGAPKRRFKPYDAPITKNSNDIDVRKARKEELKKDALIGNVLPYAAVLGLLTLVGIYLFLNNQY